MEIRIESRHLGKIVALVPEVFEDERGFFMEAYRADQFKAVGLPDGTSKLAGEHLLFASHRKHFVIRASPSQREAR